MAISLEELHSPVPRTHSASELRLLYQLYEEAQASRIAHGERLRAIFQGRSFSQLVTIVDDADPLLKAIAKGETAGAPRLLERAYSRSLNEERANHGLAAEAVAGQPLLSEILIEKYIADFQLGHEAWNDFKRTCTPNFAPTQAGQKMPGRMYYDPNERLTNTNIPPAGQGFNGSRNPDDPPNAVSDGTGQVCLAG
jgi:hypothetical protein